MLYLSASPSIEAPGGRHTEPTPDWFSHLTGRERYSSGGSDAGIVHARVEDEGGIEFDYRVYRRGSLYRCASLDGSVHAIAGRDAYWMLGGNGQMWTGPRDRGHVRPADARRDFAPPCMDVRARRTTRCLLCGMTSLRRRLTRYPLSWPVVIGLAHGSFAMVCGPIHWSHRRSCMSSSCVVRAGSAGRVLSSRASRRMKLVELVRPGGPAGTMTLGIWQQCA